MLFCNILNQICRHGLPASYSPWWILLKNFAIYAIWSYASYIRLDITLWVWYYAS